MAPLLTRFGLAARDAIRRFGYDAVDSKTKRKPPTGILQSEDAELTPDQRRKLVQSARDVQRNFSVAGWMIRKHLDYVSTFNFQSKTGDKPRDLAIENFMRRWSRKENCDVAARHSLPRLIRLAERARTVDGDIVIMKLADGKLQAIEGDRIATPYGGFPQGILPENTSGKSFTHGALTDTAGKILAFAVCRRGNANQNGAGGSLTFERLLPAADCWHHAYYDRLDQIRGIAPLAPAINTLRDTYEGCDYALAKMKLSQLFGLVITRDSADPLGKQNTDDQGQITADFGKGPAVFDLALGEDAKFMEASTPAPEFQTFTSTMIGIALKGLDIPYSFYSENFTNFSGQRQAWIQYDLAARSKRADNIDLLNAITNWRLKIAIDDGDLPKFDVDDSAWHWLPQGVPWVDPLKEVQADTQALAAALGSRTRMLREQGLDFEEIAAELAAENELLKSLGLPTSIQIANSQIVEIAGNAAPAQ